MRALIVAVVFVCFLPNSSAENATSDVKVNKSKLKTQAHEMFMHAYRGYMSHAFPADELMPISCQPRIRGITPSRGDVDDSLGNFSLTLVDSLDTLVVVGEYEEFERAVHAVVQRVKFDADFVVSVFETNIRMVGGHLLSRLVKEKLPDRLQWYDDQLLKMAADIADRLLPAFNTTSGLPYSRINLKHGLTDDLKAQPDTCTACAGTIILEWAALSRLSGNPIYEQKARKAMDFLWNQRNHGSNLMGTVLNVHTGDWIRRDASVGAGIDSYLEYTLKAYILLGEPEYLQRFNQHYNAIMRYLNKGPLFIDVHMHRPLVASRSYMDSLLAFWPGLQVLKGDLKGAMEIHEMLLNVIKKHGFLPEAFTHDLQIHWPQHLLRPEFLESTWLLYRATKRPALFGDIRTMSMLDEMESFLLAETFKYLYLIFAEPNELLLDTDNYVLTTEAHFLPLSIGDQTSPDALPRRMLIDPDEVIDDESSKKYQSVCPNFASEFRTLDELSEFGSTIRSNVKKILSELTTLGSYASLLSAASGSSGQTISERLRAWAFSSSNPEHVQKLKQMGIQIRVLPDGKMQLSHQSQEKLAAASVNPPSCLLDFHAAFSVQSISDLDPTNRIDASKTALINMGALLLVFLLVWLMLLFLGIILVSMIAAINPIEAIEGLQFLKDMVKLSQRAEKLAIMERVVQLVSEPILGTVHFIASPAQFGTDLVDEEIVGETVIAEPYNGCSPILNDRRMAGRIGVVRRGECMFEEKVRNLQSAGAIAVIIIDNHTGSSAETAPMFAMSASQEAVDDIRISSVFLYHYQGQQLINRIVSDHRVIVRLSYYLLSPQFLLDELLHNRCCWRSPEMRKNDFFLINPINRVVIFNLRISLPNGGMNIRELILAQYEMISTGILFQSKSDVDMFKQFFCGHIVEKVVNSKIDLNVHFKSSDDLLRMFTNAQLQPTSVDEKITHEVTCKFSTGSFQCTVQSKSPVRTYQRVTETTPRASTENSPNQKEEL
ncbi:Alpha-1,2-Mannosidase [Aphelenchoides besseyi]|nr:Alpha-1,2-Mannosidase [Aphelenchoides besseyi]